MAVASQTKAKFEMVPKNLQTKEEEDLNNGPLSILTV